MVLWFALNTGIISEKMSSKVKDIEKKGMLKKRKK